MPLRSLDPYWQTTDHDTVRLYCGDALEVLRRLPSGVVHTVVTSPPYWGLRSYDVGENRSSELGNEVTPDCGTKGQAQCGECYVCKMTAVFRECRRVLRDDGTFWLNIGSSYLPDGNEAGMPWRLAFALQADGWVLRQDIIWSKPTCMPESIQNRCTKSHEYLFLLAKGSGYYCDVKAIKESCSPTSNGSPNITPGPKNRTLGKVRGSLGKWTDNDKAAGRNKRSVWSVQEDRQLYDWMAEHAPEVLAEFLARNEMRGEEHEYIFLLAKQRAYYYDQEAVREPHKEPWRSTGKVEGTGNKGQETADSGANKGFGIYDGDGRMVRQYNPAGKVKSSVWKISHGGGYKGTHFATFPPKLVEPCILAGTSEVGCCPRCGTPWVRVVGKTRTVTRPGTDSKAWKNSKPPGHTVAVPGKPVKRMAREKLAAHEVGNRDPERHVTETRTLGWRPGCQCYGLELIGEQPSEPHRGKKELAEAFAERHRRYEHALAEWTAAWDSLKPLYEEALGDDGESNYSGTVPCLVMDPFIGSGTTALVCLDKGRRCWGIDLSEEYLRKHCIQRVRSNLLGRPGLRHLAAPIPGGK